MAQKTYLIGLYLTGKSLQRYMNRWQSEIQAQDLTPDQIDAFTNCLACVNSLVQLFKPAPPTP
jgi:hypothetical protein